MSNINALTADFEKGTNGNTIASTDPGSANAWDVVTIGANAAATYSNAQKHGGTLSGKIALGTTANASTVLQWTTSLGSCSNGSTCYFRTYVYWPGGNPSGVVALLRGVTSGSQCFRISVTTLGKMILVDAAGTTQATSTTSVPAGAGWIRIEVAVLAGATTGQITARLYYTNADAASGSYDEQVQTAANIQTNSSASISGIMFGLFAAPASFAVYLDDVATSPTTWIGPAVTSVYPMVVSYTVQ